MLANDIRKGTAIRYKDGSTGEMLDNKKGVQRNMSIEFYGRTDSGNQTLSDLHSAWNADTRNFERVTFTPAQQKQLDAIAAFDKMLGGL
tara:strand:+ start:1496 stop:1762 length:267 start_codon:yes stop_codon:yes gene_type:complete